MKTSDVIWQDTQHQLLFKLIDEIRSTEFTTSVFDRLKLYADHHFSLEEAYMEELNYPDAEAHIQAHNKFREELEQMYISGQHLDSQVRESLSIFLTEWLKRHVMGIDKKFEAFLLSVDAK